MIKQLSDEEFTAYSTPGSVRLTVEQVEGLMTLPPGERTRVYAAVSNQIVRVASTYYLDKYRDEAQAFWASTTTVADLIKRA